MFTLKHTFLSMDFPQNIPTSSDFLISSHETHIFSYNKHGSEYNSTYKIGILANSETFLHFNFT